jgi:glucose/arabinose dehydrogenase
MRRPVLILLALLVATSALGQPKLVLKLIAAGLDQPLAITNTGDERLFVTLQPGQIVIVGRSTPFLDIHSLVSCCNERGLLSVAFHPHYLQNGFFYVDYTNLNGDTVIARYAVSPSDPNRASPSSALILMTIAQPYANHNGGQLQFGPDGYLYIGMGDGGSGGDPQNRAQNLNSLLGKILRIDVNSASPYAVPATNPFTSNPAARGEIWAYGMRNPWRFSFDRRTGDLWIADVGQDKYEEVDWQPAASSGGENYGWRFMEGLHCFNPGSNCPTAGLTMPVIEYTHDNSNCSITGGYRYRGERYPRMIGMYIYGDYCTGIIWGATPQRDGSVTTQLLLDTTMQISSFGEDVNGELYVADIKGGAVYQLTDPAPPRRRIAASGTLGTPAASGVGCSN